jgi:tetratricopeptide (TPR) repeat protein
VPNDPDLALQFGHFYKVAGRLDEAERYYRRAAELMPGAAEPVDELAGLLRNRWSNSGEHGSQSFTAFPSRKSYRPRAEVRRYARADPATPQPAGGKTVHLIRRAASLLYVKALKVAPNDAAHQIKCAHLFESQGNLTRATHHHREAQLLTPDDPDIALQLGYFHRACGRPREAELSFKKAVELDPDRPEPAEQLAELYAKGWRNRHKEDAVHPNRSDGASYPLSKSAEPIAADDEGGLNGFSINKLLSPELAPRAPESHLHPHPEQNYDMQLSGAANGPIGGCTPPFAASRRSAAFASRRILSPTCG